MTALSPSSSSVYFPNANPFGSSSGSGSGSAAHSQSHAHGNHPGHPGHARTHSHGYPPAPPPPHTHAGHGVHTPHRSHGIPPPPPPHTHAHALPPHLPPPTPSSSYLLDLSPPPLHTHTPAPVPASELPPVPMSAPPSALINGTPETARSSQLSLSPNVSVSGSKNAVAGSSKGRPRKRARKNSEAGGSGGGSTGAGTRPTLAATGPGEERRERCANACTRCKAKKLKCYQSDESEPSCTACHKAAEDCVFEAPAPKHAGGSKYIIALESRVAKLESALAELDPNHPEINDHYNPTESAGSAPTPLPSASAPAKASGSQQKQSAEDLSADVGYVSLNKLGPEQFLGESSGFAFSKRVLKHAIRTSRPLPKLAPDHPRPPNLMVQPDSPTSLSINPNPSLPPAALAEDILHAIYGHLQSRYPFMDWARLREWHSRREQVCLRPASTDDEIGAFFIWTMYAVGVEFNPREPHLERAETYFEQGTKFLDAVLGAYDLTSVQGLLLIIFYAFRSPAGPPLWTICGFAMRLCVELGLHRKASPTDDPLENEVRKRIFWSAYSLDRLISLASGRPFNLGEGDIDVEPPVDVDEDVTDPEVLRSLQAAQEAGMPPAYASTGKLTTLSSALHSIWMFRIRAQVHTSFYTIHAPPPTREKTEGFLTELEQWRKTIPKGTPGYPCQLESKFQMTYFQTVLFTLRPGVVRAGPRDPLLMLCATAAAEACELGRTVHQDASTKHTIVSLYHIFICGMTLLHCLSVLPTVVSSRVSSRAIRACSSTLAVYAQLFPAAVPFRELFEFMADEVLGTGMDSGVASGAGEGGKAQAIGEMLVGNYDRLAAIYESINQKTPARPDTPLAPKAPKTPQMPTESQFQPQLSFELANLHNLSELASFLDLPMDTDQSWQGDWGDHWGGFR
ncbi:hypothetical protein IAT38_006159 [Cryptococcus sp. DSM 104549]